MGWLTKPVLSSVSIEEISLFSVLCSLSTDILLGVTISLCLCGRWTDCIGVSCYRDTLSPRNIVKSDKSEGYFPINVMSQFDMCCMLNVVGYQFDIASCFSGTANSK